MASATSSVKLWETGGPLVHRSRVIVRRPVRFRCPYPRAQAPDISHSFRRDAVLVCEPRRKPVSLTSVRLVGSENDDSLLFGDGADASKLRRWRCAAPSPCSGDGVWRCLDGASHDTALADMAGATVSTLMKIRCVVVVMCGGRQGELRAACGHVRYVSLQTSTHIAERARQRLGICSKEHSPAAEVLKCMHGSRVLKNRYVQ